MNGKKADASYCLDSRDSRLPDAVGDYLDQHLTYDLELMTEYIIENYDQFATRNFRTFKYSVEKAYLSVMESMKPKKKNRNRKKEMIDVIDCDVEDTDLAIMSISPGARKACNARNGINAKNSVYSTPKSSISSIEKHVSPSDLRRRVCPIIKQLDKPTPPASMDIDSESFFTIDVEGENHKGFSFSALNIKASQSSKDQRNISIVDSSATSKVQKPETVNSKASTEISSTPASSASRKRKALEAELEMLAQEKAAKKSLLAKYCNESTSGITFDSLGGLDPIKQSVMDVLSRVHNRPPLRRPVTLLLTGPRGAGKTALAAAMAQCINLPLTTIRIGDCLTGSSLNPEKKLMEEVVLALDARPGAVLLSQLDCLSWDNLSSNETRQSEHRHKARALVCTALAALKQECEHPLLVVGESCDDVDADLRKCFIRHIAIQPPAPKQREEMLERLVRASGARVSPDVSLGGVALQCSGYLAGDLQHLVETASETAITRCNREFQPKSFSDFSNLGDFNIDGNIINKDFETAAKLVRPVLKSKGFPAVPDTTWADVGGLESIREELRVKVLDPIKEPDLRAKYGIKVTGILLWGPPGCGKTLLAKAVANEAGVSLLIVNGPDLLSMYQGESERAVRKVFARAASVAPCVLFFDEFDSLCPNRSKVGGESGSKATIVNTLLTEMSGFMSRSGVYLMAATNLPAVLDPAVLRPGRFDTKLFVGLPDRSARLAVLRAATKNGTLPALASDVDLSWVAGECEHFSGADCRHLVDTASEIAIEQLKKYHAHQISGQQRNTLVQQEDQTLPLIDASEGIVLQTAHSLNNITESDQNGVSLEKECPINNLAETMSNGINAIESKTMKLKVYDESSTRDVDMNDIGIRNHESENRHIATSSGNDNSSCSISAFRFNNNSTINVIEQNGNLSKYGGQSLLREISTSLSSVTTTDSETTLEIKDQDNPFREGDHLVYHRHFAAALERVEPSVSAEERKKYQDQQREMKKCR